MKQVTASGKTVEEAIESAVQQLQTTKDKVDVHIIEEGKKGIFGIFGSKRAIVQVTLRKTPGQIAEEYLLGIVSNFLKHPRVSLQKKGKKVLYVLEALDTSMLTANNGQALNALQEIVELYIRDIGSKFTQVIIDTDGFRARRRAELEKIAAELAERAIRTGSKTAFDPMPAFERKWVHSCLQRRSDVATKSIGSEPYRHIIIEPVKELS
ncbi:RNA-binding cell elongation regulator Jag/EloR [Aciduricibacillus chroicocephali]|uniref:RNA-binding protein KhpB n=1 Tax=Aciduricibacillus chroicocephali TaxID=3054939 RepID=A0ABY9KV99_9BACI|nr:RNA-binding cell elongation regulator Jag/EloR [Bacillaceae bacterium 44XB]